VNERNCIDLNYSKDLNKFPFFQEILSSAIAVGIKYIKLLRSLRQGNTHVMLDIHLTMMDIDFEILACKI
jgi:hypothetical protein